VDDRESADIAGRLGRLEVTFSNTTMSITSSGVQSFSLTSDGAKAWHTSSATALRIDGQALELSSSEAFAGTARNFECRDSTWHAVSTSSLGRPQGPLLRIWLSAAPLQLVLPTRTSRERREAFHSAALRLAHAALLFVQLDSRIVDDVDAIRPEGLTRGSLIVLGGADENLLAEKMLRERPAPCESEDVCVVQCSLQHAPQSRSCLLRNCACTRACSAELGVSGPEHSRLHR
jgi:hypothetical protein